MYTDDAGERVLRERFEVTSDAVAEGWEDRWREFHHGVVVGRFWVTMFSSGTRIVSL